MKQGKERMGIKKSEKDAKFYKKQTIQKKYLDSVNVDGSARLEKT